MERDKDWTEAMRHALRDAETPPPAGGWERLQGAMGGLSVRRTIVRRSWRPYAAAAAVLLLTILGGELLWRSYDASQLPELPASSVASVPAGLSGADAAAEAVAEAVAEAIGAVAGSPDLDPKRSAVGSLANLSRKATSVPAADRTGTHAHAKIEPAAVQSPARETEPADDGLPGDRQTVEELSDPASDPTSGSTAGNGSGETVQARGDRVSGSAFSARPLADPRLQEHRRRGGIAVALFGGGASGATPNGKGADVMLDPAPMAPGLSDNSGMVILVRSGYKDASFRHHLPLSFGLSLRKEFRHGLSLESGVCYTLLRSDVRMGLTSELLDQKLHFIGVPLRMNWAFLERGPFSLYVGAGGMVERCVSARVGSHAVDEAGVQWSLLAAAGAQYRLGGVAALYFEPEASYYLNDTKLRTSRTDTPLTLSLRLGVRLNF